MGKTSYAVALGSNRRHGKYGAPARVVAAAMDALGAAGLKVTARSAVRATPAMGGAGRGFANAAVVVQSVLGPLALLRLLKSIECSFGRRRGRRWGPRVLDLDILLCSSEGGAAKGSIDRRSMDGGGGGSPVELGRLGSRLRGNTTLALPHPGLATRDFVLQPLEEIAPGWRYPRSGLTVRQLRARLRRPKPVDRLGPRP